MGIVKHLTKQYKIKSITLNENGTYDEGYASISENEIMEAYENLPSNTQPLIQNKIISMEHPFVDINDEIDDLLDCIYKKNEISFLSRSEKHDEENINELLIDVLNIIKYKGFSVNQYLDSDYVAEEIDNPFVFTYVGTKLLLKAGICKKNKQWMQGKKYIELAASKGENNAKFILYLLNNGSVKDLLECRSAGAYVELSLYVPQLYSKGKKIEIYLGLLNKAVAEGSFFAKTILAQTYIHSGDSDRGMTLLEEANKCGEISSNLYLGQIYLFGRMVDKDFEKAFSYFEKYKENAACSYHLGRYYLSGKYVVKQNYKLSINYFSNAIKCGDIKSYPYLIYIYAEGPKGISNTKKAMQLFKEYCVKDHRYPDISELSNLIQFTKESIDDFSIVVEYKN